VPKATVTLWKASDSPDFHADTNVDGVFQFESVADDDWRLIANVDRDGVNLWANQKSEVKDRDLEHFELRLAAPFSIQGKIIIEAPDGVPAPGLPNGLPKVLPKVLIALNDGAAHMVRTPGGGFHDGHPDAKGNFTVQNLYPGSYQILPDAPPVPYFLDSIRLGDYDALASDFQILSGAQPLTITYKPNGGTVLGAVENCASGAVELVPRDAALRRPGFLRVVACDSNNHYVLMGVRPGEYYALAIAGEIPVNGLAAVLTATVDDRLVSQASSVTVRAGETSLADLRAITRPAY
jgi:hypothetical protein